MTAGCGGRSDTTSSGSATTYATTRISSRRGVSPLAASALTGSTTTPYSANAAATHDQRGSSQIRPATSARIAAPAVAVAVATVSTRTAAPGGPRPRSDGVIASAVATAQIAMTTAVSVSGRDGRQRRPRALSATPFTGVRPLKQRRSPEEA